MLAAGFASRAVLNGHHDNAVDQGFGLFRGTRCLLVVNSADGVAAVRDQYHDLPPLAASERTRCHVNGVEQRRGRAQADVVYALIDAFQIWRVRGGLIYALTKA